MPDLSSIFLLQSDPDDALWEFYHANTKLNARRMPPSTANLPDPVRELNAHVRDTRIAEIEVAVGSGGKRYATAEKVSLPGVFPLGFETPVAQVMQERRSRRAFASAQLTLEQMSALVRVAAGCNEHDLSESPEVATATRFVPSGGALYPLEIYLLTTTPIMEDDQGQPAGAWHYDPRENCLERILVCKPEQISECFQSWPAEPPPMVVLITGVPKRQSWKYGARGYRYALLEAGHAAQNILLAATAMQLHACPVASFYDDALHDLLDLDGISEVALYTLFVGLPPASG